MGRAISHLNQNRLEIIVLILRLLYRLYEEITFRLYDGPVLHRLLNHKYRYYSDLTWPLKMKFLKLVRDHNQYFKFQARQKLKLTRGKRAIICSAASQLVMNLPPESLTFFTQIIVYPDYYESTVTGKKHKGEVNPRLKTIVFSWRGIEEGLADEEDGRNLLMHEFAHALWLEHKLTRHEYTVLEDEWVVRFEYLASREMDHIQSTENHFFRKYAFSNMDEFYAVSVENFFERPEKFEAELPEIYRVLVNMLGQDPIKMKF